MRSSDSVQRDLGVQQMRAFLLNRVFLAAAAVSVLDDIAFLQILQTQASALGLLGCQALQIGLLRILPLKILNVSCCLFEDDLIFVNDSVFAGLIENDPSFTDTVTLEHHEAFVRRIVDQKDPNFAGRAVVLAKRLVIEGRRPDARVLLEMAVNSTFSKEDQVRDANAYLVELLNSHSDW